MLNNSIRIRATASVANVSCGFDCIGYAISVPGDIVTLKKQDKPGIEISISGLKSESISLDPEKNTAGKGILSLLLNYLERIVYYTKSIYYFPIL